MRNRLTRVFTIHTGMLFALALATGGCQWQQPRQLPRRNFSAPNSEVIHIPPKELVKLISEKLPQSPLAIAFDSAKDGIVFTDWKEYEGALHIVHRWRERTRFQINIFPDFNEPTSASHVEVFDETEEKPSDPQPWYPNPDLRRPERSEEVLKAIVELAGKDPAK